jgi:hypothetical protein
MPGVPRLTCQCRYCFPIVGGRKVDHLTGNIAALGLELSDEEINEIDDVEPFDVGFPLSFLFGQAGTYRTDMTTTDIQLVNSNARLEDVPHVRVSFVRCSIRYEAESITDGYQPIVPAQGRKKFEAKGE